LDFAPVSLLINVFLGLTTSIGPGLLIVRLHNYIQLNTPHWVGLLWMMIGPLQRPRPDNTQHLQETDIHASGRIWTHKRSKWEATYPHLDCVAAGFGLLITGRK